MKKKVISVFKYLLLLGIGVFLLWLTFHNENLSEIWEKIKHANPVFPIISMVIGFITMLSRAYRWSMLLEPLGYKAKFSSASYAVMLGYFANLAIPRIGEITRCGTLSKRDNIPFDILIGTVIVERIIDLFMLMLSILLLLCLEFSVATQFLSEYLINPMKQKFAGILGSWVIIAAVPVILLVFFLIARLIWKSKWFDKYRIKISTIFIGVKNGITSIFKMKRNKAFLFHTLFIWFMYFLLIYLCFFSLEATSHLDFKAGLFALVAGGLGMSAPVQGGIGAYHWIVSHGLLLFNIPLTDGIVFATLVHTYQTLLTVLAGLFALFALSVKNKTKIA